VLLCFLFVVVLMISSWSCLVALCGFVGDDFASRYPFRYPNLRMRNDVMVGGL